MRRLEAIWSSRPCNCSLPRTVRTSTRSLLVTSKTRCASADGRKKFGISISATTPKTMKPSTTKKIIGTLDLDSVDDVANDKTAGDQQANADVGDHVAGGGVDQHLGVARVEEVDDHQHDDR